MFPADNSTEAFQQSDASEASPNSEVHGQNGATEKTHGIWPFDGPQPYKLSPEELESLRQIWDEEDEKDATVGLRETLEGRGVSSEELFRQIKRVVGDNG